MNKRAFALILRAVFCTLALMGGVIPSPGQTLINLATQGRNADFTGQPYTRPMKTGTSLPATCTVGDMYFNLGAAAGKNLYACTGTNTWTLQAGTNTTIAAGSVTPGTFQAGPYDFSPSALLVPSNASPTSDRQLGFDTTDHLLLFGQNGVTAVLPYVLTAPPSGCAQWGADYTLIGTGSPCGSGGSGGGSGSGITTGLLASLPTTCSAGTLYFATDQPAGQQIYSCSATNTWTQIVSLGGSGALAFANGSLDIVTAVVPRLAAANSFTGSNSFGGKTTFGIVATGTSSNTDLAGQLTLLSGTASYTFTGQYTSAPICTASDTTNINAVKVSATTTGLTVTGSGADVINYICVGRN